MSIPCEALTAKSFGKDVTIHSAAPVAAKENLPEHCDVRGVIWPGLVIGAPGLFLTGNVMRRLWVG